MGKNYAETIHNCNKILKTNPEDIKALMKLAETYMLKAWEEGENVFYRLSINTYKKILSKQPRNEIVHNHILEVASKANILDELAAEYSEGLKKLASAKIQDKEAIDICQKMLSRIRVLALLGKDVKFNAYTYRPNFLIRFAFDFILLPSSVLLILISIFDKRFHSVLLNYIILMLFYAAYRLLLASIKR